MVIDVLLSGVAGVEMVINEDAGIGKLVCLVEAVNSMPDPIYDQGLVIHCKASIFMHKPIRRQGHNIIFYAIGNAVKFA